MGQNCPFVDSQEKKNRSASPQRKEEGKGRESEKKRVTIAFANFAHLRFRNTPGKLLQNWYFQEHPFESRRKLEARGTIQNAHARHSCAQTETTVRKDKPQIFTSEFGEIKSKVDLPVSDEKKTAKEKRSTENRWRLLLWIRTRQGISWKLKTHKIWRPRETSSK